MALKIRKSKAPPRPFGCPMAACMAVLGGAWAPSVIWKLSGGPRRFGELYSDIPGISPKMLTARLKELGETGVVGQVPGLLAHRELRGLAGQHPLGARLLGPFDLDLDDAAVLAILGLPQGSGVLA